MDEVDEFGIPIKKATQPTVDEFGIPVKKKVDTTSTSTTPKGSTGSVQKDGSLGLQLPKSGVDIVLDANRQIAESQPAIKTDLTKTNASILKPKKERSFASEVYHKLAKGSAQLGAELAAVPELIYDAFAVPQNAIADVFNLPSLKADSDKVKKTIGVQNAVKDYYKQEVSKLKQESEQVDRKYQQGIYDSFKSGNYADGFRQLTGSFAESLPASTSIMLGGAYTKAPQLLAASTMVFGAGKNEQLKDENPNMNDNVRIANALGTGLAEGAFGTIGTGSIGSAARAIVEREGAKKGFTILKDGLTDFYKEALKKNPLLASISGEGISGWASHVSQNAVDVVTGVKPQDYNVFEGGADAFLSEAFGGAVFGGGLKGLEQIANIQDKNTVKSNFKKTFELQKQLQNPDISEAVEKELHNNIDRLVKENQQIIGRNVKNVDNLDPKVQGKLSESIFKMEEIKSKINEIKLDKNTSDESKQILLDNLKQEFKQANNLKADILDGLVTVVETLPLEEQDDIKMKAFKELVAELNPEGKEDITITNKQVLERANKNYKTEQDNLAKEEDAKVEVPITETKSQAEVQEQAEIVEPQEIIVDETTPTTNAPIDGNVRPTVEPLGEVAIEQKPTTEIVTEESTQSANDVGASEEVTKIKVYRGEPTKIDVPNKNIMWVTPNKELADEYSYDLGIGKKGSLEKGIVTESEIEVPKNPLILNYKGDTEVRGKDIGGGLRNTLKDAYKSGKISVEKAREISEKISKYEDLAGSDLEAWHTKINKPTVTKLFVEIAKDLGFDGIQTNEGRKGQDVGYGLFKETSVFGTSEAEVDINDIENFLNEQFSAKKPTEVKETPKPKKETTSNKYVEKPINEIKTDETRFQNRTELDEEQLKSIKENWNENELDPVVIWKDDKGESFILAGHHRLEAAKQLGKKAIDARYFKGTEAEAIKYATEKSNANRTMEQSYDRAKKLRQLREGGASKKEIDEFLKGDGKNKRFVTSVSYLNPKGKLMDMLKSFGKSGDKETVRLTESAADWIGDARKFYPELTDSHEDELYNYLINKGNLKKLSNKVDFRLKIEKFANQIRLFPNEPLNLESRVFKGDLEVKKEQEIDVVKKEIKSLENEREKGTPTEKRLNEITELISINNKKLGVLNKQLAEAKAGDKAQGDLFDLASAEVVEMINQKQITDEQANEFINDDRKAEEIEPIVEVIESKAKSDKKVELEEVVAEVDAVVENKKETPKVEKPTEVGRMVSASSRFRPAQRVDFEKPVIGPNGNKLISYQWAYEWTEQPNREGEIKPKRISNWDQAESSASTGRDIVHQFTIEKPNGETITVSSESVPFELGYAEKSQMKDLPSLVSAVKTLAKNKMKLAILEAQLKEYNDLKAKYEKIIPEIKEIKEPTNFGPVQEAYEKGEHKVFAIEDVWVRQYNKYNERTRSYEPINNPDKFTTLSVKEDWVNKRVKEDGGKFPRDIFDVKRRTERQEKKIGLVNPQEIDVKQQLKDKANAEVNNDLVSKEYYDNFQKEFPNTLLAIEEKSGLITIFENGETREIEPFEFVKELKNALAKGYKGIGKVTRKVVDTETKKLKANAEVDKIAQKVKDFLPSAKGVEGAKAQGFTQDQIIDLVASAVKQLISAGIEINEAIRQVTESIKERFGVDVNIDDVKAKLKETEIPQDFERKQGKKSLLTRVATGSDAVLKKAISKYSLDYEIENQEKANENANNFVEEVGIQIALEAVRSGKIVGAEKAFVYAKIIDEITNNIDQYSETERNKLEDLNVEILGEIAKEFDQESRNAGRFISALAKVYNGSMGRYNLAKQIADYKAMNNGVIPDDVLKKFTEADAKIKELEAKLEELQKEKEIQEAEQEFKNIVEAVARKNKISATRKISNTAKAKEFANKLRSFKTTQGGALSAATPMSLTYDGAIEIAATIIEQGGKLADAIKKGIDFIKGNSLLSDQEKTDTVNQLINAFNQIESQPKNITIDDFGKLKFPASLIREHVENGIDNIDDLVEALKTDVEEMFPGENFTDREIRDAVSQYGKISNPTKDEIEIQIGIMKSLGRLISGLEDAYSGKRPLRSGLQRRALTLEERAMQRKLKELLRDLPMDDADLARTWKTALDTIKSRLQNQIADLDKQIELGEKRKAEKKTIEYDDEAKALRDLRDQKRQLLDDMVGKPELTEEEKIDKAIILTQNSIEKLQEKIISGEIEYKKKPNPVTSAKLEALRELRKSFQKQIEEMRKDAGLAEMKRLETAKKSRLNRIEDLKRRIREKDYSVREQKPLPIDAELLKIESELQEQKDIYEKEKHIFELNNRSVFRKSITNLVNVVGITRLLKAGGEFSQVLVQQGFLTPEMLVRNPKQFFKAMHKLGKAFVSPDTAKLYEAEMKSNPLYPLMKKTKLSLTGTDHKLDAQEENYQLDLVTDTWNAIGNAINKATKEKKVRTLTGLIKSIFGQELSEKDKKALGDQFKEASVWKMFERGAVTYSNHIKMVKFEQGIRELQKQGKDPINNLDDYKKVANYINVFSGRANLGKAEMISKDAGLLIFSLRNAVSQFQQLNPFYYLGALADYKNVKSISDLKKVKPTVAQKMAVKSFMTSFTAIVAFKLAFMAWANSSADEDEEKWVMETDPRSSDFGKLRKGNKTFDLWHGLNSLFVLYARLLSQETKSIKSGEVKGLGTGYGTATSSDLLVRYGTNKLAPTAGYFWRLGNTHKEVDPNTGKSYRVDKFGNVYGEKEMADLFVPIYWSAVNEIAKEDLDAYEGFLLSLGLLGMSIGTDPQGEKFKDLVGGQEVKRPERPQRPQRP